MLAATIVIGIASAPVHLTNPPSVGGLTTADLIAILAVVVTIFGLLLTAIGVLVLRQFDGQAAGLATVKAESATAIATLKADTNIALRDIWGELRLLRGYLLPNHQPGIRNEPPTI